MSGVNKAIKATIYAANAGAALSGHPVPHIFGKLIEEILINEAKTGYYIEQAKTLAEGRITAKMKVGYRCLEQSRNAAFTEEMRYEQLLQAWENLQEAYFAMKYIPSMRHYLPDIAFTLSTIHATLGHPNISKEWYDTYEEDIKAYTPEAELKPQEKVQIKTLLLGSPQ